MKTIIVEIDKTGEVKIETQGFSGGECLKAVEKIKKALGVEIDRTLTSEYYATVLEIDNIKQFNQ